MKTTTFITFALAAFLTACGGTTTTTSDTKKEAAAAPIALKQAGKAEGVDVTVTAVDTPKQIGPAGVGPKAGAGETFVVVSYTIKNTGSEQLSFMDRPGLSLVDDKGQTYTPDDMATPMAGGMMEDPTGISSDLNPNVSAKTKAAWKVDKAAFDKGTWKLVVASDPQLTFALK
jgi:hypothetical protein